MKLRAYQRNAVSVYISVYVCVLCLTVAVSGLGSDWLEVSECYG